MTIIDLRTYCKQIKQLIDTGQTEEAISHCLYILGTYPKHLDTYRVLGEAYLESGEHSEAADIFQRVLSSIPDDFVAHIGMSVIREEDEKLDEAIWHMERAFEIQPSNSTIQSEIRRLYGSREGIEPQKVRLTRGALARMYVKGSLFPQAIGELQAALTEDQNRFDLKILLSDVYFKSGKEGEGIRTAEDVLNKLPYCYGANLLLASYYERREPIEDAKLYRDRLIELDPYIAHMNELDASPAEIPDNAVEIEKYILSPVIKPEGEEELQETEMITKDSEISGEEVVAAVAAAEILSEIEDDDGESLPEEMAETAAISEEIEPAQHSDWQQALEEEITDEEDTKPVVVAPLPEETVLSSEEDESIIEPEPAGEGDIPDWLMELADEETSSEMEPEPDQFDEAAGEIDTAEESVQTVVESELSSPTADEPHEEISPEMETELGQFEEQTGEPTIADKPIQTAVEQDVTSQISDAPDEVTSARMAIESGDKEAALAQYSDLIKSRQNLTTVIGDLEKAAEKYPDDAAFHQKLGDAYLRNHQINEAMGAYSNAEQLL